MENKLTGAEIKAYEKELQKQELASNTIKKYLRELNNLIKYLDANNLKLDKDSLIDYKDKLEDEYKPNTVNNKIIILNKYLTYKGLDSLKLKQVKQQVNHNTDNVMTDTDFNRILRQAEKKGTSRDKVMLLSLYYTGLRVSELEFLTVESVKKGYITVKNKGKIRKVPIAKKLDKELKAYVKEHGIEKGAIILNKNNEPLSRNYIFKRLKYLGGQARVKKSKVYPHSIRHLFAKQWLKANGDNYLQLADILGHSSLETTRIYSRMNTDEMRDTINF